MTDADMIKHLWTHKTQDHPVFSDEELLIERGQSIRIMLPNDAVVLLQAA